jgi:hypothetical protein
LVTGGNTNNAASSTGVAPLQEVRPEAHGQSSLSMTRAPPIAQLTAVL